MGKTQNIRLLGSVHYLWPGEGGGFGKIDRQKKKRPPSRIRGKKIAPPMTLLENFVPPPHHVLKTCLYVAIVLPQQL